jgi:hypothetical protein
MLLVWQCPSLLTLIDYPCVFVARIGWLASPLGKYEFFQMAVDRTDMDLTVTVTSFNGDPDLFISKSAFAALLINAFNNLFMS